LSPDDIARWQALIDEVGTVDWLERLIDRRLSSALDSLDTASLDAEARSALVSMAAACTERVA
jgi:geranylgeranyl diphosphate synthase type I